MGLRIYANGRSETGTGSKARATEREVTHALQGQTRIYLSACTSQWIPEDRLIPDKKWPDEMRVHAAFAAHRIGSTNSEWYRATDEITDWFIAQPDAFQYLECGCGSWKRDGVCVDHRGKHARWLEIEDYLARRKAQDRPCRVSWFRRTRRKEGKDR